MTHNLLNRFLANENDTCAFGRRLAPILRAGDKVLLSGAPGAGKTSLARSVIQTLAGKKTYVTSPAFPLVQTYDTPRFPICHADLYRLLHPCEIDELGLDDNENTLLLLEWPERSSFSTDIHSLAIQMDFSSSGRMARLSGNLSWTNRLATLP